MSHEFKHKMNAGDAALIRELTKLNPELTKKYYADNSSSSTTNQRPEKTNDKLMPDIIPAHRNVDSAKSTSPLAPQRLEQENERLKGVIGNWKTKYDDLLTKQGMVAASLAQSKEDVTVLKAREETHVKRLYYLELENETLKRDLDGSQSDNAALLKEMNTLKAENETLKKVGKDSNAQAAGLMKGKDKLKDLAAAGHGGQLGHKNSNQLAQGGAVNNVQKKGEIPIASANSRQMGKTVAPLKR